jgi:peroxiredoxin
MTQPPADFLERMELLLSAGRQQEARRLLGEYINLNPASARAWWLMSLSVTDVNQQKDCLQRVLLLDPENKPARERLATLVSQPPVTPPVNPFTPPDPTKTGEPNRDGSAAPAWAEPPQFEPAFESMLPAAEKTAKPMPTASGEPAGKVPPRRKSKTKWGIVLIVLAGLAIIVVAAIAGYLSLQRKAQAQAQLQSLQETLALAQTLTSLPLPTLISTWTASPSSTALPTITLTGTPTLISTFQYTLTRTTHPTGLVGPLVGLYAPDFNLIDSATGERVTLNQFIGQPLLIFFWTSGCPACNDEMNSIETIARNYEDDDLVVLSINAADALATVSAYRITHQLTFPTLLDPGSVVQSAYLVNFEDNPRHFFVNSSGRITFIGKGEMTLNEMKVQADVIVRLFPTSTP